MQRLIIVPLALIVVGCGPKKPTEEAPRVGWHQEEGWAGACYFPPNFEAMGPGDRRLARQKTLSDMMEQWKGARNDGVSFDEEKLMELETVLLGQPEDIELAAVQNLQKCKEARVSGDTGPWYSWVKSTPGRLTEGQCKSPPMRYTLFDYLDITSTWQIPVGVCAGDKVRIKGSTIDYYKITNKGPWMTVEGNPGEATIGGEWPCNLEGCVEGILTMRFTDYDGVVTILPVGKQRIFSVPNHGKIEVMINDVEWHDNKYKQEGSMIHHTSIEYAPAE